MLVVHEYPTTGQVPQAIALIHEFAAFHKPVLLGETSILSDDAATQEAFLSRAAPDLSGAFEFFDGRDPRTIQATSVYDAVYQASLKQFIALRPQFVAPPR